jgi:hypothetical protein
MQMDAQSVAWTRSRMEIKGDHFSKIMIEIFEVALQNCISQRSNWLVSRFLRRCLTCEAGSSM